ncbi:MAG: TM0106 family RecB-like putative nuclease [Gammaproteobacteria bacterium]|nr:TM0106 family RecB-like putative nuclease [Gammaproteobacteria bacterium]
MHRVKKNIVLAPTDLGNFLNCRHLSGRDLAAANGQVKRPIRYGPVLEELKVRGAAHESAYLAFLEEQGLSVVRLGDESSAADTADDPKAKTLAAMERGADVIYQASLSDEHWAGRADFLRRVEVPSDLGDWSYEVYDTKLARNTRASTVLQLCVYSHLLGKLQDRRPALMHVVMPGVGYKPETYRADDYSAYFRLLEQGLEAFVQKPGETYPDPVSHCDLCAWWSECESRRRADDHLGYVAGISGSQISALRLMGINRLATLAQLEEIPDPPHGSREALERTRDQARVQSKGREQGIPYYELRQPFDTEHGLALLPEPTPDDIFLDFEGNHFIEHGVQEYLTGYLSQEEGSADTYTALWARMMNDERQAFERFIDHATAVRARNPGAHIYHFAPYEPAALKRLMGRFATREVELDALLRGGAFVDLYTVVRRAMIAGVEHYSIKDLEPFFGYQRSQDLRDAAMSRRLVEHAIETETVNSAIQNHIRIVENYNREDCESAKRLRDWLEELRAEVIGQGAELPRPVPGDGEASAEVGELDRELQRLRDGLLDGVPTDREDRSDEQHARFLLAHMMEFHRREDKAAWWEYFRLLDLEESDYPDERRAVAGLEFLEVVQNGTAPVHRYCFPPQDLDARPGDDLRDAEGTSFGSVQTINYADQTLDIKKRKATATEHRQALVLHSRVPAETLQKSLMRLGQFVIENGLKPITRYKAAVELLLRRPSALVGASGGLIEEGEDTLQAACRLALQLDGHVLAIQGPPGTGKTFTGANMICELVQAGLKVGVTAVSHKVIVNLMEGAMKQAAHRSLPLRAVHKQSGHYEGTWSIKRLNTYPPLLKGIQSDEFNVVGATAWCWSRPDFEQSVDVLIVDEAGQMSLSNVLAVAPAGRSLVLLGDPQQLEQPLQSSHPEGSEVSALSHLLAGEDTMPQDKGLFLGETHRLHPEIARFTSEVYYEGKVAARPELINQAILPKPHNSSLSGSGLRFVPVEHAGNQARSYEEARVIKDVVDKLLDSGQWRDKDENVLGITPEDILIVAPYNAQVAALREAVPKLANRIGTVDRFQGQEAAVVIYSMTSSSPEDAPRGMEFLYDPHRFNVATSRAMAMCILVGSPALFEPDCRTPRQMKMANGFCRYLELCG